LAEYLRKKTVSKDEEDKIKTLVRKLGDASFEVREKAKDDLLSKGSSAVATLTQALKDTDPEIVSRAKECLEKIGEAKDTAKTLAVIRLLGRGGDAGAIDTLLAYAPSATNEAVAQEVAGALAVLGVREGKVDPRLEKAFTDKDPRTRAVAAAAF